MPVSDEVERRIADAPLSAHLATSVDDRPHVAPVWYVYEDEAVWILTGGKKLRNVRENSRVAVSIERSDGPAVDWAVQLLGTANEVEDDERIASVQEAMDAKYRGDADADGGENGERESDGGESAEAESDADDGDEDDDPPDDWALLEIDVGSASYQQY